MNKKAKYLLLLPITMITSCGYSLSYIVEGNLYNSPVFSENYYQHWDNELKNSSLKSNNDVSSNAITSYQDIGNVDPNFAIDNPYKYVDEYGMEYRMNKLDESFNYGVQSKLFDGRVFCERYFQRSRVQTDENGFSVRFAKESDELHYFAMQFKATTDNALDCYPVNSNEISIYDPLDHNVHDNALRHDSHVNMTISLYCKNGSIIEKHQFNSTIDFNGTTNDGDYYVFYAFDLEGYNLSRLVGFSVEYTVQDDLIDWNKNKGLETEIDYALFIYEVFLPYTYWH